jgi:RNA polymerase sigma factor (sigma-70 family)
MATGLSNGVVHYIRRIAGAGGLRDLTDRQLLERFAAVRDEEAFRILVERYGALVLGVCRRVLRHEQDAEDAFQATFLVLARKAGTACWRESVGNWLYEVAHRLAAEARKHAARRRRHELQAGKPLVCPPAETARQELCSVIDQELQHLPARYRAPVVLCCLQGMKRSQAARQLGWTEGMVKGRLERGRNLLRRRLVRRGLLLSPGLALTALTQSQAASVPAVRLVQSTVRAATWYIARCLIGPGLVSARAAILVEGATMAMLTSKLKTVAGGLLALVLLGAGVGVLAQQKPTGPPTNANQIGGLPEARAQVLADGSLRLSWRTVADLGIRTGQARARAEIQPRVLELAGSTAIDPGRVVRVRAPVAGELIEIGQTNDRTTTTSPSMTGQLQPTAKLPAGQGQAQSITGPDAGRAAGAGASVRQQAAATLAETISSTSSVSQPRPLRPGDRVKKGGLLAVISCREVAERKSDLLDSLIQLQLDQATLEQMEAHRDVLPAVILLSARRTVETDANHVARAESRLRLLGIPDADFKALKESADRLSRPGAKRDLKQEAELARLEVRAPMDGILIETSVAQHEVLDVGRTLFVVADLDRLQVIASAPQGDLPALERLSPDQRRWTIRVPADSQAPAFPGVIDSVGKVIDPKTHKATVRGSVDNSSGRLRAGQFVTATVRLAGQSNELAVPASALVEEGGAAFVFVQPNPEQPVYTPQAVEVVRRGANVIHVRPKDTGARATLYRNNGNGTFTDVTGTAGLDLRRITPGVLDASGKGLVFSDVVVDGTGDIYVIGNGAVFVDKAVPAGAEDAGQWHSLPKGMGVAVLDYDADGQLDLLVANAAFCPPVLQAGSRIVTSGAVELQALHDDLKTPKGPVQNHSPPRTRSRAKALE